MKILAMDIGAGTVDLMLYDDKKRNIENCVKMVLPTPSIFLAEKVRKAGLLHKDVFIRGLTIGGGAFAQALRRHIDLGLRVYATEPAAYSIRNNLDEVRDLGIKIVSNPNELANFDGMIVETEEINLEKIRNFLAKFGEPLSEVEFVAIAVQDHGVSPKGESNRKFRIKKMEELLRKNPEATTLAFKETEIPVIFLRMKAAAQEAKRHLPDTEVLLMDTAPAAILGCLQDPIVERAQNVLAVNVGNGHTMAAVILNNKIIGIFEHHTRLIDPRKIEQYLIRFADGHLGDEEIFLDNGHGVFFLDKPSGLSEIDKIIVTGPNRSMLKQTNLSVHFAAPSGDVMMTGPVGLVQAVKTRYKLE